MLTVPVGRAGLAGTVGRVGGAVVVKVLAGLGTGSVVTGVV